MDGHELTVNLVKMHTTELGMQRIQRNMDLGDIDLVAWCKHKVSKTDNVVRRGKNWYVYADDCIITVNASGFTIITVHKNK